MICKSGYYYVYYTSLEIVLEESEFLRFLLRKVVCELSVGLEIVIDELLWKKRRVECGAGGCKTLRKKIRVEYGVGVW